MDKNTIIGFALIAAVLFGFTWFNQPTAEDVEAQRISDSLAVINQQKKEQAEIAEIQRQAAAAKAMAEDSTALFFNNMNGVEGRVTLENEKIALTFNTKGAVVEKAVIKNFEDLNGAKDLTLFDKTTQSLNFIFTTKEQNISTKDLYFDVKKSADGKQLIFVAGDEAGKNISVGPSCSIACRDGENEWNIYNASNKEQQRNDGYIKYKAACKRFFKRWNLAPIQAKEKLVKRTCWIAFSVICAYMALYIILPLRSSAGIALPLDSSLIMLWGLAITLVLIAILFPAIDSIALPGGTQIKTSID